MALVCLFALIHGDKIERVGAVAFLCSWMLTIILSAMLGDESHGNWIMIVIDLALLATFASIVWKAPRNWPIWACAFQLLIVASQALVLLKFSTPMLSYYIIVNMASFGILIALAIGTFFAWQEQLAIRTAIQDPGRYS